MKHKNTATQKTSRFGRLVRPPAWKWSIPILQLPGHT